MKKDVYYFSHDSNAQEDENVVHMRMELDWYGYGLYWALIERLRTAKGYRMQTQYERIAYALRTHAEKVKRIVEDFGLFEFKNGYFWSNSLLERMKLKEDISEKARISAIKRWGDANAMRPHSEGNAKAMRGQCKERKVKESKRKEITTYSVLSEDLYSLIKERNPKHKEPNIDEWSRHIRLLHETDNKPLDDIKSVIVWCQNDSFWQNNILSTKKLREKFDQLFLKMNSNGKPKSRYEANMEVLNKTIKELENGTKRNSSESVGDIKHSFPGKKY